MCIYISNLGTIAQQKGYSQRALAEHAGLSLRTVQRYWRGRLTHARIRLSTLEKLCRVLQVQIGELIIEQRAS